MEDPARRRLRPVRELSDQELVDRYRRLFQSAQETPPESPAWYDLEVAASLIAGELKRRAARKRALNPDALWAAWQKERGGQEPRDRQQLFTPEVLDRTVIAVPLLKDIERDPGASRDVIIDLNLDFPGGRVSARDRVKEVAEGLPAITFKDETPQYMYGTLTGYQIQDLVRKDQSRAGETSKRAIFHIWPDFAIGPLIFKSASTVKADAARQSFTAMGEDIVWAVIDSGVAATPHFESNRNLELPYALSHRNFTNVGPADDHTDDFGHGTHVAGIIAGYRDAPTTYVSRSRDESGKIHFEARTLTSAIQGIAPKCKLLSLKVLDAKGDGKASSIISALGAVQEINGYGRRILVHGVNLSVGYNFEPEWFACGQSPLCVEVNRLVKSGVVVVVAAGNTGYGYAKSAFRGTVAAGMSLTINDPGNAEEAITVGSTHRDMPHVYGVSYFSSKGPTGDGRPKPDLVAPGEKIISCATGSMKRDAESGLEVSGQDPAQAQCDYTEDSGTSMAAPHVSGVIAAFLSVRREFIGRPEEVKRIFVNTATDLRRDRYFQGAGLVDLMRAIQSV